MKGRQPPVKLQSRPVMPEARMVELLDAEFLHDENDDLRHEVHEVRATVDGWHARGFD